MTARADAARERVAVRLGFAAVAMAALAFALVARDAAGRVVHTVEGLVAPEWTQRFADAETIRVTTNDETLTLEKGADGWTLDERGGHVVEPAALTTLHRDFTTLRFSGARTRDPDNFDRLGVADPAAGGSGVRLTVLGAEGGTLEDWIVGSSRQGGFFIRRPDEDQTYAAAGELPDLRAPGFWMDLDFLGLDRVDISQVAIAPAGDGMAYTLVRGAPAASDFTLLEPVEGYELITAGAANGPGGAAAGLRFTDVRPRAELTGEPAGTHAVRTFDGLDVTLAVYRDGADSWATVETGTEDGAGDEAAAAADAIAAQADGWAFKLPQYAADRLIRTLDGIARPAAEEEEDVESDAP